MGIKIQFDFDPEEETGIVIPKGKRSEALDLCADFLRESILNDVSSATSPVAGERWKRTLSPAYKKLKEKISSSGIANMELSGDMLDSLEVVRIGNKLRVRVSEAQNDKADGHCNFSGESSLPQRRFIPNAEDGQTFKPRIIRGVRDILAGITSEEES